MIYIVLFITIILLIGGAEYIRRHSKKLKTMMSFKEAIDLVGLPIVTLYQNGNKYNFLLDTGANYCVIDSNWLDRIKFKETDIISRVSGIEGNDVTCNIVEIDLYRGEAHYSTTFQTVDMAVAFGAIKKESGVTITGILGSDFFVKYQYMLDYKDMIAYSKA